MLLRNEFDAACLRAIARVGATTLGEAAADFRIPADRLDAFVDALQDELDGGWDVRWAGDLRADLLYAEHHAPAGITHLQFTKAPPSEPAMIDLTCTHYY